MLYIVHLEQTVRKSVLIEAADDAECGRKLRAGRTGRQWKQIVSERSVGDWEVKRHTAVEHPEDVITSAKDLASYYGCPERELNRVIEQITEYGMTAQWDKSLLTLYAHVDGPNSDALSETLRFPFSIQEFIRVRDELESEVERIWRKRR